MILHFNDVYEIDARARDPCGGVARFIAKLATYRDAEPLVLFSGDFLAPSLLSTTTEGAHMVHFFNRMHIGAACLGNHDFDHGIEACTRRMAESNFPYLLSNAVDTATGAQLAGARSTLIIDHGGVRVGLMGLIEEEWLATLNCVDPAQVRYTDYVEVARTLERQLRSQGCDLVIALTHMRGPNDKRLAQEVRGLDLVLGGHDHEAYRARVAGVPVIKSGTDFREFTRVDVALGGPTVTATWERVPVNTADPEDAEAAELVRHYSAELAKTMDQVVGSVEEDLECRFPLVRSEETSGANWVADEMRRATEADVAFLNSGTLRADDVITAGPLRMRELNSLLPMLDELCVLAVSGHQLRAALENGVSMWPRHEGRFPAVSGVRFSFDGAAPPGRRVGSVAIAGEALVDEAEYRVVTKNYLRGAGGQGTAKREGAGGGGGTPEAHMCLAIPAQAARTATTCSPSAV